ncbi:hypothetical protein ACPA0F_08950 [Solibacillus silvestris]
MTVFELDNILERLGCCFTKGGFVTVNGEFIANKRTNAYFNLMKCDTYNDVCCKVLEWLSRECYKAMPFSTDGKNEHYHKEMLASVNLFLGTAFTEDEIALIYQKLGNAVNHELTMRFVKSDYDINILKRGKTHDSE